MVGEWSANVSQAPQIPRSAPDLPDGAYPTRLDDRGRLRLPAAYVRFFDSLAEKKLFVTSMDGKSVRIYPIAVWRQTREWLATHPDPAAADIFFLAMHHGANAEMDSQGRILIHEELRRELNLENRPLRLLPWVWRVDVVPEDLYLGRKQAAEVNREEKLVRLTALGLR
ncbi:MAG: division/cell wall cluster transcriptional repressor MraZ [Bryobacteraceae bacterium]